MKKAAEYRHHAQECRTLARNAQNGEHRTSLLNVAETWEALAAERERLLRQQESVEATFHALPTVADEQPAERPN